MPFQENDFAQQQPRPRQGVMYVDVNGYEGPLDLLLDLARKQKVDLAHISVLSLAEQYLTFIETLKERRIEVAADYLVMAAWLAYLKSRLMVPHDDEDEEPSGEEMAALLQFRLKRLEAMRDAAGQLINRPRLVETYTGAVIRKKNSDDQGQPMAGDLLRFVACLCYSAREITAARLFRQSTNGMVAKRGRGDLRAPDRAICRMGATPILSRRIFGIRRRATNGISLVIYGEP